MKENFYTYHEYYASANGYQGFKSYFSQIFNSSEFEKVFVLKGGPGTGKSSIIKKLCVFCKANKIHYEIFRCSSDPDSLDAIIIDDSTVKVAVLDGTAPHMRDAEIPGAVDEIINLGQAWDSKALAKSRESIIEYNFKKNSNYKKAYEYLYYSSVFDTNIEAEIAAAYDYKKSINECELIIDSLKLYKAGKSNVRLISSFSKQGYRTLTGPFSNSKKNYSVFGRFGSENIFIGQLADTLMKNNADFCKLPSPFNTHVTEGIMLNHGETIIFGMGEGEFLTDTTKFIKIDNLREFEEKMHSLENSKNYYLNLAAQELKLASDYHFKLEDIYTPTMNFDIINEMYDKMLSEIKNIYSIRV